MNGIRIICISALFVCATDAAASEVYVATGLGFSHLDPDTSEVSTDVIDRVNAAGQITLGLDINKWVTAEVHSADLGSAGLNNNARINYHVHGLSGLIYAGKNRDRHARQGLVGYGRLGVGYLENSPVGDVRYERENPIHLLFGAGIEYNSSFGFGARVELLSFDNDALYTQAALLYRFGGQHQSAPKLIAAEPIPPVPKPEVASEKIIEELGTLFNGMADGVGFVTNSSDLTSHAKTKLDNIAALLNKHSTVNATISAHTDSVGTVDYNQNLSRLRATKVVSYLSSRGVDINRLQAKSFGESKPIASNKTAEGREQNRRVEIVVHSETR